MWIILPIIYGKFMFQTTNQTCFAHHYVDLFILTPSPNDYPSSHWWPRKWRKPQKYPFVICIYIYRKNEDEPGDFRVSYFQTNPYESSHSTACQPCNATHLFFLAISLENVSFAMFHTHNFSI